MKWSDDKTAVQRTKGIHQNLEIQAIFEAEEPDEEPEPGSGSTPKMLLTVKTFQTTRGKVRIDDGEYDTYVEKIVPYGTSVTISAQPEGEYVFTRWSDNNTEQERTIVVDDDITINAIFADPDLLNGSNPESSGSGGGEENGEGGMNF